MGIRIGSLFSSVSYHRSEEVMEKEIYILEGQAVMLVAGKAE